MEEKSRYKSLVPANGEWYFVSKNGGEHGAPTALLFPVALWAETHEGDVVGLLGDVEAKTDCGLPRLVGSPTMDGFYTCRNHSNTEYIDKILEGQEVIYRDIPR